MPKLPLAADQPSSPTGESTMSSSRSLKTSQENSSKSSNLLLQTSANDNETGKKGDRSPIKSHQVPVFHRFLTCRKSPVRMACTRSLWRKWAETTCTHLMKLLSLPVSALGVPQLRHSLQWLAIVLALCAKREAKVGKCVLQFQLRQEDEFASR